MLLAVVVVAALAVLPAPRPAQAQAQTVLWSATLNAGRILSSLASLIGCQDNSDNDCDSASVLTDNDFSYSGTTYTVHRVQYKTNASDLKIEIGPSRIPEALKDSGVLKVGSRSFALADATRVVGVSDAANALASPENEISLRWTGVTTAPFADGDTVQISLSVPAPDGGLPPDFQVLVALPPMTEIQTQVKLSLAPNPVPEGSEAEIRVTMSPPVRRDLAIPIVVTAVDADDDDIANVGSSRPFRASVRIDGAASGTDHGTLTLPTRHDDDSDDETYTVAIDTRRLPAFVTAASPANLTLVIQDNGTPAPADCADLFQFGHDPVPVAKTADGQTTLATVQWGYNATHNLCYFVLDDNAVDALRANAPTTTAAPSWDEAAAERCQNAHNPDRGFAGQPVPVAKTADGQTTLATVQWGYNATHNLCYLVLDDNATTALRTAHQN